MNSCEIIGELILPDFSIQKLFKSCHWLYQCVLDMCIMLI